MNINIFYMAKPRFGGWVTSLCHTVALNNEKDNIRILKIGNNTEKKYRDFGYNLAYRNISKHHIKHFCDNADLNIIFAVDKNYSQHLDNFPDGTRIIVHDPTELKGALLGNLHRFNVFTFRAGISTFLKSMEIDNTQIKMPFSPSAVKTEKTKTGAAISRIDWDKHTDIIIKANNQKNQTDIYGNANRLYAHHKLEELGFVKYYKGDFPRKLNAVNNILKDYQFLVDMSAIKNDGGGTQMTFMEAWDNDCVVVLSKDWFKWFNKGEMQPGVNCLTVENETELTELLSSDRDFSEIIANGKKALANHQDRRLLE